MAFIEWLDMIHSEQCLKQRTIIAAEFLFTNLSISENPPNYVTTQNTTKIQPKYNQNKHQNTTKIQNM